MPLPDTRGAARSLGFNGPLWAMVSLFAAFSVTWSTTVGRIMEGERLVVPLPISAAVDRATMAAEMLRQTAAAFPNAQSVILARLRLGRSEPVDPSWTIVEVDGKILRAAADPAAVEAALRDAGFSLDSGDRVVMLPNNGRFLVQRAVPFSVVDGGVPGSTRAAAGTVGEALRTVGIDLHSADVVRPPTESPLLPGLRISILRAQPVTIAAQDVVVETRSRAATVGELLAEAQVPLGPLDRVEPPPDSVVPAYGTVQIVRVREDEIKETRLVPFQTRTQYSDQLEAGSRVRLRAGVAGLIERVTRVVLEDGVEVERLPAVETVVREPVDELVGLGPPVARTVSLPGIALPDVVTAPSADRVKRVLMMEATAYDPGPISTGKSPGHPAYGITASGMRATYGVVAVDPRVIPFYTRMYVPGYGYAIAADTGGAIVGNRIDVYYPTYDEAIRWGRKMVPVYILE